MKRLLTVFTAFAVVIVSNVASANTEVMNLTKDPKQLGDMGWSVLG